MSEKPKKSKIRLFMIILGIVSLGVGISIAVIMNYGTIANVSTVTSILTDFPMGLFDQGYDIICLDQRTRCLVQSSPLLEFTTDEVYLGKNLYSFSVINDTTILYYDSIEGSVYKYTSYHFYQHLYKISSFTDANGTQIWYLEAK